MDDKLNIIPFISLPNKNSIGECQFMGKKAHHSGSSAYKSFYPETYQKK
jgi:hypothetical protein